MAEVILKAVEFDKCSAKFRKLFDDAQALWDTGWALQPKYDGCFGLALISCAGPEFDRMLSRTGENYTVSCAHILAELREAADEQSGGWDSFVVLGEVWHQKWPFPTIGGKFRKQAPCPELVFMAHDLLPPELNTETPYSMRYTDLRALLPEIEGGQCAAEVVKYIPYDRSLTVVGESIRLKALGGYDGAVLKDYSAPYTIGLAREGQIVKVKPTLSLDLRVLCINSALGNKTGRVVYTLLVEYRGVQSTVGSGVPHILNFQVGDIVEVECMGITDDGALREPRLKGVRYDKTEQDT